MTRRALPRAAALLLASTLFACGSTARLPDFDPLDTLDSGGPLSGEQAAFDVERYELDVEVFPDERRIEGEVLVRARIGAPIGHLSLDLDPRLEVHEAFESSPERPPLVVTREGGKLRVFLPRTAQPGDVVEVVLRYGGVPREAPNAPWTGGFTWARTDSGEHWIATTCQGEGPDLWWPAKDHVSDSPDSMRIRATVPSGLVVASNGRLTGVETLPPSGADGTSGDRLRDRFTWEVSTPIEAYNVTLQIAPYVLIERTHDSVSGETFPLHFYALRENREKAETLLDEIVDHVRFFEETLGPYPFRADKLGIAETPHLGMEHQTINAYGARYERTAMTRGVDWGFDALAHHELSHEWWGNLVTNADWADMWLHEGFGSYMQPLYLERRQGRDRADAYLASIRPWITNERPLAPRHSLSSKQVYGGDIYFKGAWVLHTLRGLVGDQVFFHALRRMAYPGAETETLRDGSACRFATTDDFVRLIESLHGQPLDWFFEVYVRSAALPRLVLARRGRTVDLRWIAPGGLEFPLPIDVRVGEDVLRVELPAGRASLELPEGAELEIDPMRRVLRETP